MAQRAREGCKSLDRFVVRCVPATVGTYAVACVGLCEVQFGGAKVGCASVPPN